MAVSDLDAMLRSLEPRLNAGSYVFVSLPEGQWVDPSQVVASVREAGELSVVMDAGAAAAAGHAAADRFAWITLGVNSDLQAVGLTAEFSRALAAAGIGCNVIAGARHDHIFVPERQALAAMRELQALQKG